MRRLRLSAYALVVLVGVGVLGTSLLRAQVHSQDPRITLMDTCDANTFPGGLCVVVPHAGDTTFGEFLGQLFSPNIDGSKVFVGHPAWRFEPSYLSIKLGQAVIVTNSGGEEHTFTEVSSYGGGSIGTLNGADVSLAPGCPANPADLAAVAQRQTVRLGELAPGVHKFQCCIHPWMRAVVDVE